MRPCQRALAHSRTSSGRGCSGLQPRLFPRGQTSSPSRCAAFVHLMTVPLSVQFHSVTQLCPTLCEPMNHSTPGLPVHHQLPEFTQTHVHRGGDAIQPSHPLSSPISSCPQSLPASGSFPMSQLFSSGGQSTGVAASASVLPMNTQD